MGDGWGVVVVSAGHVGGTRGSGIMSNRRAMDECGAGDETSW